MADKFEEGKRYVFSCRKFRNSYLYDGSKSDEYMLNDLKGELVKPSQDGLWGRVESKKGHCWSGWITPEICTEVKQNYKYNG